MNKKTLKTIVRYITAFFNYSFVVAGYIFFVICIIAMAVVPTITPADFGHVSSQKMIDNLHLTLPIWQCLFCLPFVIGLIFTLTNVLTEYLSYKHELKQEGSAIKKIKLER